MPCQTHVERSLGSFADNGATRADLPFDKPSNSEEGVLPSFSGINNFVLQGPEGA